MRIFFGVLTAKSAKFLGHDGFSYPFHLNPGNLLIAEVFLVPAGHAMGYDPEPRQTSLAGPSLGLSEKTAADTLPAEGRMHQKLSAGGEVSKIVHILPREARGKLRLIDNTNQAQNLNPPHSEYKIAVRFLYVTLEFIAESLALLMVHMISKLLNSSFQIYFASHSYLPSEIH